MVDNIENKEVKEEVAPPASSENSISSLHMEEIKVIKEQYAELKKSYDALKETQIDDKLTNVFINQCGGIESAKSTFLKLHKDTLKNVPADKLIDEVAKLKTEHPFLFTNNSIK